MLARGQQINYHYESASTPPASTPSHRPRHALPIHHSVLDRCAATTFQPCLAQEDSAPSPEFRSRSTSPRVQTSGSARRRQGGRGTCSVFATVEAIEFAQAKMSGKGFAMSVEFANWAANQATGRNDDGDFFKNIIAGVKAHGICPKRPCRTIQRSHQRESSRGRDFPGGRVHEANAAGVPLAQRLAQESPDSTMLTFNESRRYWQPVHRSVQVPITASCLWAMKTTPR